MARYSCDDLDDCDSYTASFDAIQCSQLQHRHEAQRNADVIDLTCDEALSEASITFGDPAAHYTCRLSDSCPSTASYMDDLDDEILARWSTPPPATATSPPPLRRRNHPMRAASTVSSVSASPVDVPVEQEPVPLAAVAHCMQVAGVVSSRLNRERNPNSASQCKNWCFTINNPANNDIPKAWEPALATYCVWQRERGVNGTEHLQGYVQLCTKKRLAQVKQLLDTTAHWEVARGTPAQNEVYCTKPDTRIDGPWTYGVVTRAGERTDIAEVYTAISDGMTMRDVAE